MKIALLWPDYWPYIRRGTERVLHDQARYLIEQGHEVEIIATKPGRPTVREEEGIRIRFLRQISHPLLIQWRAVPRFDFYGWQVRKPLLEGHFDLLHLFFYSAAPAAQWLRRVQGTPYIYHVMMIPPHFNRVGDPAAVRYAIAGADEIRSLSHYCEKHSRAVYGREGTVVYPTVDVEHFQPVAPRVQDRPRILFTADLRAVEKGAGLLAGAYNYVHAQRPDAILEYAGPSMPEIDAALYRYIHPEAREGVRFNGVGTLDTLARRYSEASVTVLPSVGEPFGMVLTESLACGTPVVGTRSGGIGEIISDPQIGRLFDVSSQDRHGNAQRLAAAILEALELAQDPATVERCRAHAQRFSWRAQGPRFDEMQRRAMARHSLPLTATPQLAG